MADQTQKRDDKDADRHRDAKDERPENRAPNPTDLEFYNDPVVHEQWDGTGADEETRAKGGTERDGRPRGNRRPDEDIKAEIHRLLAWQQTMDATGIQVDVQDGVVTLSGNARSPYEKEVAGNITGNVLGIREIQNLLEIHEPDTDNQT